MEERWENNKCHGVGEDSTVIKYFSKCKNYGVS